MTLPAITLTSEAKCFPVLLANQPSTFCQCALPYNRTKRWVSALPGSLSTARRCRMKCGVSGMPRTSPACANRWRPSRAASRCIVTELN